MLLSGFPEERMGSCCEIHGRRAWSHTSPRVSTSWWSADSAGVGAHFAYRWVLGYGQAICRALADRSIHLKQSGDDVKIEQQSKIEKKCQIQLYTKQAAATIKCVRLYCLYSRTPIFFLKLLVFRKEFLEVYWAHIISHCKMSYWPKTVL